MTVEKSGRFLRADIKLHPWLSFDPENIVIDLGEKIRKIVFRELLRRGAVIAVSGGIDSAVCAGLAVSGLGKEKVFGLLLPEKDSSPNSLKSGEALCQALGISYMVKNITGSLDAIGCYEWRDSAIRKIFPQYTARWKSKIAISRKAHETDLLTYFTLVVESPEGERFDQRLPPREYLQIVAATSFKQRVRKTLEFFHADRLNYAVVGTPNRLEYDQGFFVKNGDGAADLKPIAHMYKSQVYELGRFLGLPGEILSARPTTDTYSLEEGQDEFYFSLPYEMMDIVLFGANNGKSIEEVSRETGISVDRVRRAFDDIHRKRKGTRRLHLKPLLLEPVPEIG